MLPSQWRDVGQQLVRHGLALRPHRTASTTRPRYTAFQTLMAITMLNSLARLLYASNERLRISPFRLNATARFNECSDSPLFSPASTRRRSSGPRNHSSVNRVRCTLPSSRNASASPFWRGEDASFRRQLRHDQRGRYTASLDHREAEWPCTVRPVFGM